MPDTLDHYARHRRGGNDTVRLGSAHPAYSGGYVAESPTLRVCPCGRDMRVMDISTLAVRKCPCDRWWVLRRRADG